MNGPIVAERGAVVRLFGNGHVQTFATGTSPDEEFLELRDRILRRLTSDGSVEAIMGDPSNIIRTRPRRRQSRWPCVRWRPEVPATHMRPKRGHV